MQNKNDTTICSQNDLASLIKDSRMQKRQRSILLLAIKAWDLKRGLYDRLFWIGTNYDKESADNLQRRLTSDFKHAPIEILQQNLIDNRSTSTYSLNRHLLRKIHKDKKLFSISYDFTILSSPDFYSKLHQLIVDLDVNGPEYIAAVAEYFEFYRLPQAYTLYTRAAELGGKEAKSKLISYLIKLGDDYLVGANGKSQDYTQAKLCYENAIQLGSQHAKKLLIIHLTKLAEDYFWGANGKSQDYEQAKFWYEEVMSISPDDLHAVEDFKLFLEHRQVPFVIRSPEYYEKIMRSLDDKLQQLILDEIASSDDLARLEFPGSRSWLHVLSELTYSPRLRIQSLQNAIEKIISLDNDPYTRSSCGITPFFKLAHKDPYNILRNLKPSEFIGIEEKEAEIHLFLEGIKANPHSEQHLLLISGPPGVGKTEVTKAVLKKQGFKILEYVVGTAEDAYIGQKEKRIKEYFDQVIELNEPVCLFIDEIDTILPDTEGAEKSFMLRNDGCVNIFQTGIDSLKGRQVVLIGTTNYLERIKPAIKSRAGTAVIFDLPDRANRELIIKHLLSSMILEPNSTIIEKIADATTGWSPRQLKNYIDKVANTQHLKLTDVFTDKIFETCFEAVRKELERPKKGQAKIIAPRLNKLEEIQRAMPLSAELIEATEHICSYIAQSDIYLKINPGYKVHTLLFGPPGGGKTEFARLIVEKINCPCFVVNPGNTVDELADVLSLAKSSEKSIIFIDEFDRFASSSGAALLLQTEMDGFDKSKNPFVIIAATNHLERIALPVLSRFGNKLEVSLPTEKQRSEFFKSVLTDIMIKTPDALDNSLKDEIDIGCVNLGEQTEHFSIRDMYSVLNLLTPVLVKRLNAAQQGENPLIMILSNIIQKVKASVEIEHNIASASHAPRFFSHPLKHKNPDVPNLSTVFNRG
ncbi:AAA family ATPase [Legionella sp. km535]|uniref:AAA family ATPase n=1 Tax=Legionella sp. km535 TaxID=2498107 RepID=UPI000F8EA5E6|nr:AAA family ATPase [Legionella sp. km535]RUR15286.1 AAA family ATPase [Legionella sp. km535]